MLLMLIIGWVVVLPALVVGGLMFASRVLGRRAARAGGPAATGLERELAALSARDPFAEPAAALRDDRPAVLPTRHRERHPVGAAH
jgi:hypothetical protein